MPVFLKAATRLLGLRAFMYAFEAIDATSYLKLPCLDFVAGIFVMGQNMQHQGAAEDVRYVLEGRIQ